MPTELYVPSTSVPYTKIISSECGLTTAAKQRAGIMNIPWTPVWSRYFISELYDRGTWSFRSWALLTPGSLEFSELPGSARIVQLYFESIFTFVRGIF